jgi:hypothetical protein
MLAPVEDSPPPPTSSGDARERRVTDRRMRPTPMISRYLLVGRRRAGRREGEKERIYVDRPGPWALTAFGLLTALSVADAVLTLDVIGRGATEANPLMRAALDLGNGPFVVVKTGATVVGAAFLCLHKNWALGRLCLWAALAGYLAVMVVHYHGQTSPFH